MSQLYTKYSHKLKNLLHQLRVRFPILKNLSLITKKSNRPRLIYSLTVINFVIAIALLAVFYNQQLLYGVIKDNPKVFNLAKFDPKTRYLVKKADIIKYKSNPEDKIKVLLTQPKIKITTTANKQGDWRIAIPSRISEKRYKMTVLSFDKNGKNPKVKYYLLRVESNYKLANTSFYKNLQSYYRTTILPWLKRR